MRKTRPASPLWTDSAGVCRAFGRQRGRRLGAVFCRLVDGVPHCAGPCRDHRLRLQLLERFLVLLGGWLLANAQGWVRDVPRCTYGLPPFWLLGLYLIFGGFRKPKIPIPPIVLDSVKTQDGSDFLSYAAVFGGVEAASDCKALRGGKLSAIFGGVELDLRRCRRAQRRGD